MGNTTGEIISFVISQAKSVTGESVHDLQESVCDLLDISNSTFGNIRRENGRKFTFEEAKAFSNFLINKISSKDIPYDMGAVAQQLENLVRLSLPANYENNKANYEREIEEMFGKWKTKPNCDNRSYLQERKNFEGVNHFNNIFTDDLISIDMCSFCGSGFLLFARNYIDNALKNGVAIRYIMNDPLCDAAVDAVKYKTTGGAEQQRQRLFKKCYDDIKDWQDSFPDSVDCRLTDMYLPYAMLIMKYKNQDKDFAQIDLYSFDMPDSNRRIIMVNSSDKDNYKFFIDQFEYIWEHQSIKIGSEEDKN